MISSGIHTPNVASKHVNVNGKNSRYNNSHSLEFDGTDDYADCTLSSDIFNKTNGTISLWCIFDSRGTKLLFNAHNSSDGNADFFRITSQGVTGNSLDGVTGVDCLLAQYTTTLSGTRVANTAQAMQSSSFHGHGHTRKTNNFSASTGGSGFGEEHVALRITSDMDASTWFHIVYTWDTNETFTPTKQTSASAYITSTEITGAMRLYVNGVLKQHGQSGPASNNQIKATSGFSEMTASLDTIRLGLNHNLASDHDGHMNNVAVWNSRLTDAEVLAIYNSGTPTDLRLNSGNYVSASNLVGYWTMQDGHGAGDYETYKTVFDRSVNNNHLTLRNNTVWTTVTP